MSDTTVYPAHTCPRCGALPGEDCNTLSGKVCHPHAARVRGTAPAERPSWSDKASELATRPADGYRAAVNDHCASVREYVKGWRQDAMSNHHHHAAVLTSLARALATGPVARQVPADLEAAWARFQAEKVRQTQMRVALAQPERLRGRLEERVRA